MKDFQSMFAEHLSNYVQLRCALGFRSEEPAFFLEAFDTWIFQRNHTGPLTQEVALEFACSNPQNSTNYCARRYQVIRHFSEYLATFDPRIPFLDPKALQRSKARTPRHIYTDQELQKILYEARHVSLRNPVRGLTLHAMIGLAASTGLRISEVIRLDREDVDLKTGVLNVRYSKFNKSRLVPLHITTLEVVGNYAAARDAAFPNCKAVAFFMTLGKSVSLEIRCNNSSPGLPVALGCVGRKAGAQVSMTSAIALLSSAWYVGIKPASTFRACFRSWRPTWDTLTTPIPLTT